MTMNLARRRWEDVVMDPGLLMIAFVVSVAYILYSRWDSILGRKSRNKEGYSCKQKIESSKDLDKHIHEERMEIVKVGDNIHVARGFGLANCVMIEGDDGIVIIDTMENIEVASQVKAEFDKITSKPIKAIILTHFHADHAFGTEVFTKGRKGDVDIYAHESFSKYYSQVINVRSPITFKRAVKQFGTELPKLNYKNVGIGMNLKLDGSVTVSYVYPTKTFSDRLKINVAGLILELIHAPGETNDQIIVWYQQKKILFPADNIYKAFPNLYAIRGTMHRDTLQWVRALDIMRSLKPDILVPQHWQPLYGEDIIMETLTAYRDAIQFVHDQTVRYMNKGLTDREISQKVVLPKHLSQHPYLIELYGTVEWSVRGVYHGYMGWFSGRPAELHPLPIKEEASLMIELAGGVEAMLDKANEAVEDGHWQWGLQLTDTLIDSGNVSLMVKELRGKCLRKLAYKETSAPGRNWYLTSDMEMADLKIVPFKKATKQRIQAAKLEHLFLMLTCRLDADKTIDVIYTAVFKFSDNNSAVVLVIRKGVCQLLTEVPETQDLLVETTGAVWRDIMAKDRQALAASLSGDLRVTPGIRHLGTFMKYFDTGN